MNRESVTLIFDIGKTTKKALIFDKAFHVREEKTETFREIEDDDGFAAEDLDRVSDWVTGTFQEYIHHPSYQITHCNISAYGASLVHLDAHGDRIKPFYNYLKTFPASTEQAFRQRYDKSGEISAITASPFLGLLNSGLQLFWLKSAKPALFDRIKTSLHLPQYFTYLLSKQKLTDITSVGCHTMLWDFRRQTYHEWVKEENLEKLFPPLHRADYELRIEFNGQPIGMGIGVHDSSAALMPYLATQRSPFLLLSTGTWNICFNPFNHESLTPRELAADCLCFLTYEGDPVKASRIFLGHEHEVQCNALTKFFQVPTDAFKNVAFNEDTYQTLNSEAADRRPFFPLDMTGTGPIPEKPLDQTNLAAFQTFEEAYHQLVRYLVKWQLLSIDLIDPQKQIRNIIVVGGFTKNNLFLDILKRSDNSRKVLISDHPRASALGAAWLVTGKTAYEGKADLLQVNFA